MQKKSRKPGKAIPKHVRQPSKKRTKKSAVTGAILAVSGVSVLVLAVSGLLFGAIEAAPKPVQGSAAQASSTSSDASLPSVSEPAQPTVQTVRFSATGDNLIHDGIYLQAAKRTGGTGYDFAPVYENLKEF